MRKRSQQHRFILHLICCGMRDSIEFFATWAEADDFRESYCSGPAVAPHGYQSPRREGHQRAGIIKAIGQPEPRPLASAP